MSTSGEPQALEGKLRSLFAASSALAGSSAPADLLQGVLELSQKLTSADACAIWREDIGAHTWRIASSIGLSEAYRASRIVSRSGIIGERPFFFEDVNRMPPEAEDRRDAYAAEGIRSLLAMPMTLGGQVCGTLAFYYHAPRRFSESDLRVAAALTCLASSSIETADLYREQERARVRASFLAEASAALSSSLDYTATLASVARLAASQVADWCVVDMVQPDGGLQRLACAHADPAKASWAEEMSRQYPARADAAHGPSAVVRSGASELHETISDEMLVGAVRDPEQLDLVRSLGFTSYMCVPLAARGRVLGAITFISDDPGRRFDADDLALAEDLARRAAMAVDNAMLYGDAQRERSALEAALTALRENEERLLLAMDAGRLGIWDWELRTSEIEMTDDAARLLGFAAGLFPRNMAAMLEALHPDDRAGFVECTDRAIQQKSYFECEFRLNPARGPARWLVAKGKVFCDETGEPARMIAIAMDITERRLLEAKLREAQKMESIGLLAGGIAHDFNNLLTGILGNASLALELLPRRSEAAPLLDNVVEASERAADLTRQLLAYSGKGRMVVEPVDLASLIDGITHLLQTTVPKLVALDIDVAEDLPAIEGDSSQVQQVVMNLVINAAEAIGERAGTVSIGACLRRFQERVSGLTGFPDLEPGSYVCLEIRDDGCGMDPATLARVFDPFFTTKFTGRGLGLAAVFGIVRSHRGAVRVASSVGSGSCFEVLFPAAGAAAPRREEPVDEDLTGSGLVLVVDDEPAVRSAAAAALRRYGYRIELAHNGAEAVAAFGRAPADFAAVLLDLTMPVLGGEKAAAAIKKIRPAIPVVASSGYNESEASSRFGAGRIDAFVQKPYTAAALARVMKRVVPRVLVQGRTQP